MADKTEQIEAAEAPKAKAHFDFNKLNTLAVVSLATAVTGFGAIAAVITGHISLSQVKKSGESGRPLALAGLILGYVGIAIWILGGLGLGILRAFLGARYGFDMGDGHMQNFDGGIMGGRDFDRDDHGGMMGGGWQMPGQVPSDAPSQ